MQGTMQLEKGIAYTQDTKLDGVPADLTIKGHTNLNTFEIDKLPQGITIVSSNQGKRVYFKKGNDVKPIDINQL